MNNTTDDYSIGDLVDCLVEAQKVCNKINMRIARMPAQDVLTCSSAFEDLLRARSVAMDYMLLVSYQLVHRLSSTCGCPRQVGLDYELWQTF